jgi:hypothetical protein
MSITSAQLVFRKSLTVSDTASNGGAMSFDPIVSGVKNNLWPDIFESERAAGSTKYRKMFLHVNNNETNGTNVGLDFVAPRLFVETRTPGDDSVNIFLGSQTDQQSGITGTEGLYGMGILTNTATVGAGSITVTVEDWANLPIFRNGDVIRVSDKTSITDSGNNEEYHVINGAPSAVGNEITLTLTGTLANGYAAGAKVSSVIEPSDVQCAVTSFSNNGSGTFSVAGVATDQTGTIQDSWTLTFLTSTTFSVTGAVSGSVGTGSVGSDFSPANPETGGNLFRLLAAEFSGSFVASETITWTTSPAGIPIWVRRDVPAGAATLTANSVIIACDGESA